jgi:hypothetical protein
VHVELTRRAYASTLAGPARLRDLLISRSEMTTLA